MCEKTIETGRPRITAALRTLAVCGLIAGTLTLSAVDPASAAPVGLVPAPSGAATSGMVIDVTVNLTPNGADTSGLLGHQLFVGMTGLEVVSQSWGTAYGGLGPADYDALTGVDDSASGLLDCTIDSCETGLDTYEQTWQSLFSVLPNDVAAGTGSLFTLRLTTVDGTSPWAFSVVGNDEYSLMRASSADPNGFAAIVFGIVDMHQSVAAGTARVAVSYQLTASPVPEPSSLALGLVALAALARRRARLD